MNGNRSGVEHRVTFSPSDKLELDPNPPLDRSIHVWPSDMKRKAIRPVTAGSKVLQLQSFPQSCSSAPTWHVIGDGKCRLKEEE